MAGYLVRGWVLCNIFNCTQTASFRKMIYSRSLKLDVLTEQSKLILKSYT